jgi:hypothetical protein
VTRQLVSVTVGRGGGSGIRASSGIWRSSTTVSLLDGALGAEVSFACANPYDVDSRKPTTYARNVEEATRGVFRAEEDGKFKKKINHAWDS